MLILVTGGSGSGKSAYAENRIVSFGEGNRIYIATMMSFDEESRNRIRRHRNMRAGKGFETLECYTGLKTAEIPEESTVLLECMSNLVANEMFSENGAGKDTVCEILEGVRMLREKCRHLVIVTNEIFSEAASYEGDTGEYQRYLGTLNRKLAEMADEAVEVVYGIPVWLKGKGGEDEKSVEQL